MLIKLLVIQHCPHLFFFCWSTAIKGIWPLVELSLHSWYEINQPSSIQAWSSCSYASLKQSGIWYSTIQFHGFGGSLSSVPFHEVVHDFWSVPNLTNTRRHGPAWSIFNTTHTEAASWNHMTPVHMMQIPPNNLMSLYPSSKSKPSRSLGTTSTSTSIVSSLCSDPNHPNSTMHVILAVCWSHRDFLPLPGATKFFADYCLGRPRVKECWIQQSIDIYKTDW